MSDIQMAKERIEAIYTLLRLCPEDVYNKIFKIRGITIRNKISIVAATLKDQKFLESKKIDMKTRNRLIKRAAKSLEEYVAKYTIKNMEQVQWFFYLKIVIENFTLI